MDTLPLIVPGVMEAGAPSLENHFAGAQMSTEWNGRWQNARMNQGDAAAWALVVFFLVTLGLVAGCVAAALTRPRGPTREHLLIDEVLRNEEELAAGPSTGADGAAAWEKPADWWREEQGR